MGDKKPRLIVGAVTYSEEEEEITACKTYSLMSILFAGVGRTLSPADRRGRKCPGCFGLVAESSVPCRRMDGKERGHAASPADRRGRKCPGCFDRVAKSSGLCSRTDCV